VAPGDRSGARSSQQSLVDGLRVTETRVPLKPRARGRRRLEIGQMRTFLVWAQEIVNRQEREAGRLRPWPGAWEASVIEEREERERAQEQEKAGRGRHGLRVLAGGRA